NAEAKEKGEKPQPAAWRHTFLIIQGIDEKSFSVVKEVHFYLDQNQSKQTFFGGALAKGQGLIVIKDMSPWDLNAMAQQYVAHSHNVTPEQIQKLFNNIEKEQTQNLSYVNVGSKWLGTIYANANADSCLTWCKRHLKAIGVNDLFIGDFIDH